MRTSTLLLLALASCGGGQGNYPGNPCADIPLGPAPEWLGRLTPFPVTNELGGSAPYIKYTAEVSCCFQNPFIKPLTACSKVDCQALYGRLTVSGLGPRYPVQPCGEPTALFGPRPSVASCAIYRDGDSIVAISVTCED